MPVGHVGLLGGDVLAATVQQPDHDGHQVDEVHAVLFKVARRQGNLARKLKVCITKFYSFKDTLQEFNNLEEPNE